MSRSSDLRKKLSSLVFKCCRTEVRGADDFTDSSSLIMLWTRERRWFWRFVKGVVTETGGFE